MKNTAEPIRFLTPKKVELNGLLFSPEKTKTIIIFIHGLGGTMFWPDLIYQLASKKTAVLAFNNRGYGVISRIKKIVKNKRKSFAGGCAHEVFQDCPDDIQGAINFCKKRGFKKIILVGHSTGCQKSVYYLAKTKNQKQVDKLILLCPISDYADAEKFNGHQLKKAVTIAKKMIKQRKKHELLPHTAWHRPFDAQRFLSLYTPNSKEEIFCYATEKKNPTSLKKVKVPILTIFAEKDEYMDRSLNDLVFWFAKNLDPKTSEIKIIKQANHNFSKREKDVIKIIRNSI